MREMARQAGITTPVLYDHFASKAELVLRQTIDAIYGWIEANPAGWRMIFLASPGDPAVAEAHRQRQQRATDVLAAQFSRVANLALSVELDRARASPRRRVDGQRDRRVVVGQPRPVPAQIVELTADPLWRGRPGRPTT